MNWEATILYIRQQPEYANLVEQAYLDKDLSLNVERFKDRAEYQETLKIIRSYAPQAKKILDIGSGNGISTISFAEDGYDVTAVEPDSSETVGAGAIKKLIENRNLQNKINLKITTSEELNEDIESFDVIYIRQAMHHANDLSKFVSNTSRFLKKGGLFLTVRDHVIFNDLDKEWFLKNHPLHKFYNGENAFTSKQYKNAFVNAGLEIKKELKYYDSVINYYPSLSIYEQKRLYESKLTKKYGALIMNPITLFIIQNLKKKKFTEKNVPGRLYSYICIKK